MSPRSFSGRSRPLLFLRQSGTRLPSSQIPTPTSTIVTVFALASIHLYISMYVYLSAVTARREWTRNEPEVAARFDQKVVDLNDSKTEAPSEAGIKRAARWLASVSRAAGETCRNMTIFSFRQDSHGSDDWKKAKVNQCLDRGHIDHSSASLRHLHSFISPISSK